MEINEDGIELTTQPLVLIDGKKIDDCEPWLIEKSLAKLLKKITEQRSQMTYLRSRLREAGVRE